ncbi:putative membrane protein [Archaeoglobus sulfaticallidus PM70-1]|uniref:Putative membrane protein n=1 Tax=Archaeoglobus sulfaticallidus PM70-1 TaxID=387631 RepID=N0BAS3_9EURY|nr:DUF1405 domain-containing protein [Archaeoglobus sulfaticallidus]AGK60709.1 putative membrane protein [Archaeoglobus sulfaticallidus PM70-1]
MVVQKIRKMREIQEMLYSRKLMLFIVIANLMGAVYGYYYYRYQLMASPEYFWILITDCPNASLFIAVAVTLILIGRKSDDFSFFSSANLFKYGLWTMSVLIYHKAYFFSGGRYILYSFIFVTHFLLFVESFWLISLAENVSRKGLMLTVLWMVLNDFSDYILNTHPYIPESGIELVAAYTVILSAVSILLMKRFVGRAFLHP